LLKEQSLKLLGLLVVLDEIGVLGLLGGIVRDSGAEHVIPPGEGRGVVAQRALVVQIVSLGTAVEGDEVERVEGEVVAGVHVHGLEHAHKQPEEEPEDVVAQSVHGQEEAHAENEGLQRVGILSGHAEGRIELVVNLVDPVDGLVVHGTVAPVVVGILNGKSNKHLPRPGEQQVVRQLLPGPRQATPLDIDRQAHVQERLDDDMSEGNQTQALQDLSKGSVTVLLDLVLVEGRDEGIEKRRDGHDKVDDNVQEERNAHKQSKVGVLLQTEGPKVIEVVGFRTLEEIGERQSSLINGEMLANHVLDDLH